MKRSALILSIVITTFVLGIVGGVVKASTDSKESATVEELRAELQTREELYSETIAEANNRINQANEQLKLINEQKLQAEQTLASIPTVTPETTGIGKEKALELAMKAGGLNDPNIAGKTELVNYNGQQAFEIELANGNKFYLNSDSGEVLYNSVIGGPGSIIDENGAIYSAVVYMQGGHVFSVEKSTYEEKPAFLVTFDSGEKVYVDLAGQVMAYVQVQTYAVYTAADNSSSKKASNNNDNDDHDDDDHEDDHDEDHDDDDD